MAANNKCVLRSNRAAWPPLDNSGPRRVVVFARLELARAAFQRVTCRRELRCVRREFALPGLVGRRERRECWFDARPSRRSERAREEDGVLEIGPVEARNNTSARQQFRLVRVEDAPGSRQSLLAAEEGAAGTALDLGPRDLTVAVFVEERHDSPALAYLGGDRRARNSACRHHRRLGVVLSRSSRRLRRP